MTPAASAIADELRAAFPATRAARFTPMVNSVQGHEPARVASDFADRDDWTTLQPDWLDASPDGLSSALSFLADEAVRFYIPAYLAADLKGALKTVDPAFELVHGFDDMFRDLRIRPREETTWTDLARARWDGLSHPQAAAVVHYLEWLIERDGIAARHGIVEALAAYWYARAAFRRPGPPTPSER